MNEFFATKKSFSVLPPKIFRNPILQPAAKEA